MSIMPIFHTGTRNSYEPMSRNTWDPPKRYPFESAIEAPYPHPQPKPRPHPRRLVISHHDHQANESLANARIEWKEVPEAYFIRTELPGVRREEVKVEVEDDKLLKISGQRNMEYEDSHDNWHHVERSKGKFMTAFMLPEDAWPDQVRLTMENGVLTITVPKRQAKHHVRPVEIVV